MLDRDMPKKIETEKGTLYRPQHQGIQVLILFACFAGGTQIGRVIAIMLGDLSENAEYDAAKDAQGMLEMRINDLEKTLSKARIVDASQLDGSKVTVFSKVTIKNIKSGKELTYQLVSESEADLKVKKISVDSPMGAGLLGKEVGEIALVETPRGKLEFEIVNISL